MKKIAAVLTILICITFFSVSATALEKEGLSVEDVMPPETVQLLSENGFETISLEALNNLSPQDAVNYIFRCVKSSFSAPFTLIYALFLVILVFSVALGINGGVLSDELEKNFSVVGILSIVLIAAAPIMACFEQVKTFTAEMTGFVQVFVPVFSSALITSGQISFGSGYGAVMLFSADAVSSLISGIIIPLMYLYLVFSIIGRASFQGGYEKMGLAVKSAVVWALTLTVTLFVSLVTINGIIGAGSDSVALRTGKFFVGSFVPAVGGALAEAASTVQTSLGLIKNTTGVFGIIAAFLYFVPPLIKVLLYKLTCDISAMLGDILGAQKISGLLRDISNVLGITTAIILSYATVITLSIAVALRIGGGA